MRDGTDDLTPWTIAAASETDCGSPEDARESARFRSSAADVTFAPRDSASEIDRNATCISARRVSWADSEGMAAAPARVCDPGSALARAAGAIAPAEAAASANDNTINAK